LKPAVLIQGHPAHKLYLKPFDISKGFKFPQQELTLPPHWQFFKKCAMFYAKSEIFVQ